MQNPFEIKNMNFSQYLRNHVAGLEVGQSIFIETNAPRSKLSGSLCNLEGKFSTKAPLEPEKVGKGVWVKRIA